MKNNIYIYILVAAAVTYAIRTIPLTLLRKPISNKFIRSFLYYVPYVTLAVMTVPAIFETTDSFFAGFLAFAVGIIIAWLTENLFLVAFSACAVVYLFEMFL